MTFKKNQHLCNHKQSKKLRQRNISIKQRTLANSAFVNSPAWWRKRFKQLTLTMERQVSEVVQNFFLGNSSFHLLCCSRNPHPQTIYNFNCYKFLPGSLLSKKLLVTHHSKTLGNASYKSRYGIHKGIVYYKKTWQKWIIGIAPLWNWFLKAISSNWV